MSSTSIVLARHATTSLALSYANPNPSMPSVMAIKSFCFRSSALE